MQSVAYLKENREMAVTKVSSESPTRRKILDAAIALFDSEGVRSATVDAISANAGVTKRTLYYHFRSKDDLMVAALEELQHSGDGMLDASLMARDVDARRFVVAAFGEVAAGARDIRWKGCAFIRAATELAGFPGHPAAAAARKYKQDMEKLLFHKLVGEGFRNARSLSRQLVLLLDGAIVHGVVHHDPTYALEAARCALDLLDNSPIGHDQRSANQQSELSLASDPFVDHASKTPTSCSH
ncbi:AcrR family transcriptional regulator [Bradyrhizobium sp. USDA 4461]